MNRLTRWAAVAALLVAATLPYSAVRIPGLFHGPFSSAGTLQLLAMCCIFAGLAQSYDLVFGRTGMLSFGHALYFACGTYTTTILVTKAGWPLWEAATIAVVLAAMLAAATGAIALRTNGVAFAMVTLAFAQIAAIVVVRNPGGVTGGSDGLALDAAHLPAALVGVENTVNLYWLALAFLTVIVIAARHLSASSAGRVLSAIRDNELRTKILGLNPYRYKLVVFVLGGIMAAAGGVIYALTVGGASPHNTTTDLSLSLLVMVVIGGPGTRWGPVIGAIIYTYLNQRLTELGTATAGGSAPAWVGRGLSQPLLLLGVAFIGVVYFAPGGLTSLRQRMRLGRWWRSTSTR
jgi:branched-chain amino acid transport system permease protein